MGLTAKKALGAAKKYTDDQIEQIPGGTVVDVVEDGNMNPVTSNAVYDEAQEIKLSISNLSASVLHTSGNETATGVKTFSSGVNSSKGVIGPKASGESDPHIPLELRGSDTEAWLLFSSRLGSGLGYFGTKSDNKPYFYNTEPHELAFKSQIPIVDSVPALDSGNAVSSGGVYAKLADKMDSDKIIFSSHTESAPVNGNPVNDYFLPGYQAVTPLQVCSWSGSSGSYAEIVHGSSGLEWHVSGSPTDVVYGKLFIKNS